MAWPGKGRHRSSGSRRASAPLHALNWSRRASAPLHATCLFLAASALLGCGEPRVLDAADGSVAMGDGAIDGGAAMVAVFDLEPEGDAYFDLPWPNDLRRADDGSVAVGDFPGHRSFLVAPYLRAIGATLKGWGANGAAYQRFSATVNEGSLPSSVDEALGDEASVFLLDVDDASPTRGARHPAVVHYQDAATKFWPAHTVSVRPVHGDPLAWGRTYAAIITRGVIPAGGGAFERDQDFDCVMRAGASCAEARVVYREALDALPLAGVDPDDVLSMAVFTVQGDFEELLEMRDWLRDEYPPPAVLDGSLARGRDGAGFVEIIGRYGPSPIVQRGEIPYIDGGGDIELEDGAPVLVSSFDPRFSLSVPSTPPPPNGYPLVLFAHGTGGDYQSYIGNGVAADLAAVGIAVLGVDQIHHGERNPTETASELLVYNVTNPLAFRDNARQSALDVVQEARLVASLVVPGALLGRGDDVSFDPENVFFFGHSQGGQNGPLFLAIDDHARVGVLSGAGSIIAYALLEKTEPLSIPHIVKAALGLPGSTDEEAFAREGFGFDHPIVSLLQMWLDAADAGNYAHLFFASPRPGFARKSILQTLGTEDPYAPPGSIEALATAIRLPLCSEELRPLVELDRLGVEHLSPPVTGNASGDATACLLEQVGGHFVAYEDPARAQIVSFLESAIDGIPTLPSPL
jgi:predicted esterase